jgi:hypothetical protein
MPTGAFFIQQPIISLYSEKNVVREQKQEKIIHSIVLNLLSSNFLVASHDSSTRSRLNDNKYLGIITTYTKKYSTLYHSKYFT